MRRFRFPFPRPGDLHRDIDDELDAHIDIAASALEREGLAPDEARAAALSRLGDREALHRSLFRIDHRSLTWARLMTALREFFADVRFALRRLRHRPLFTALTTVTIATGIGTALTFVGAAETILLRPLPIRAPDEVITVWRSPVDDITNRTGLASGTIADLRRDARSFVAFAGARPFSMDIQREGGALSIGTWQVTDGFFQVMQVAPVLGHLLQPADFAPGAEASVVVSQAYWQTHLSGDSSAIGRFELLDGVPHRIRGILPADFPIAEGRQLYVPVRIEGTLRENRVADFWSVVARMRDGVGLATAEAELRMLAQRSDALAGAGAQPRSIHMSRLDDAMLGDVRRGLGLIAGAALLLLLMATTSTSGVLLADTMSRERELAIRASIGAGRQRIARQLIAEAATIVASGAVAGVAIGAVGLRAFARWSPVSIPRLTELGLDTRILGLAILLSLGVTVLVTIASAKVATSIQLHDALRAVGSSANPRGRRIRSALVMAQVALAVMFLCCGGLLLRSWTQLSGTDQGYTASGVMAVENHIWGAFRSPESRAAFASALTTRLSTVSGIDGAAVASTLPLAPVIGNTEAEIGRVGAESPLTLLGVVASPGFFSALNIALERGRFFTDADGPAAEPVVVISASAAMRLFPNEDAVGQMVNVTAPASSRQLRRIVGVVDDVRYVSPEAAATPTVYVPHAQAPTGSLYFLVRPRAQLPSVMADVKRAIGELMPGAALNQVVDLADAHREATVPRRFALLLLSTFAVIALSLTVVGLFGLLSQIVRARACEMGIRLALGAPPEQLRRLVLREGLRLAATGTVVGLVAFLVAGGALRSFLYGVPPRDPITIALVVLLMLVVAAGSSWWPAVLAARSDPLRLLRSD